MDNVIVMVDTDPALRKELEGIFTGYKIIFNEDDNTSGIDAATAGNTTVILGNAKPDFVKLCPRLKWLQLRSAGANGYVDGEISQTITLSCASGCYGHAVSEHMIALTVTLLKKLHLYRDEQNAGRWKDRGTVKSIQGATVLIVGLGDIGSRYARCMKGLGAHIIGIDRLDYSKAEFLDEYFPADKMEELLSRADVVATIVPGTNDNAHLFGRPQLAKMKKDAVIINCGRGTTIDTEALCDALEGGALGGAGLDVTDPEPLPPGHRLWKQENALIAPHVAGAYHLPDTRRYIMELFLENARRFIKGEKLKSVVDYKTGYRVPEK